MKRITKQILVLLALIVVTACAPQNTVSDAMKTAMNRYADEYARQYPNETINTARECATAPSGVYWNSELQWHIVTCAIPNQPTVYGIVFLDDAAVSSTCNLNANSQKDLERILRGIGYE